MIFTTSWDDGHPLDLRLAELLAEAGAKGTFYIPKSNPERDVMGKSDIRELRSMGMEIGSHTGSHVELPQLPPSEMRRELEDGKHFLEDILGEPVTSFCYPRGKFSRAARDAVEASGHRLARTTVAFRFGPGRDPFRMPTTLQFCGHPRAIHLRHALKEGNLPGLATWAWFCRCEAGVVALNRALLDRAKSLSGIFHLWGHSWEIEKLGLWQNLRDFLVVATATHGVRHKTNGQLLTD